jgi:hypothetical protein
VLYACSIGAVATGRLATLRIGESLIPGMIGPVTMDVGLFAYWWTGIAGDFTARPIAETGVDMPFLIAFAAFATSLLVTLFMIWRLRQMTRSPAAPAART